ncbi:MAG TPA: dienelactone hydrolase family protein [Thermoanaerobaculia bacterium]|nr:dienelactone hydrolase family protein [Thermoanaerobaculia bacterium]
MKKTILIWAASVLLLSAHASSAGSGTAVTYKSGDENVSGYLAAPSGGGRHPGLIVVHEWWGLNDWVRGKADHFAANGYVALAVDLYRGKSADHDADLAHQLMRGLPEDRAARDLDAAFRYLAGRPDVDPSRIGSIGWCMGGGYALQAAIEEPTLAACVVNYGRLVTDPQTIAKIRAPMLGNFGAEDQGIPPAMVQAFEKEARAAGKSVDFKVYPGAGHGFASNPDPKVFRPDAARDADARTDAFLGKELKKA